MTTAAETSYLDHRYGNDQIDAFETMMEFIATNHMPEDSKFDIEAEIRELREHRAPRFGMRQQDGAGRGDLSAACPRACRVRFHYPKGVNMSTHFVGEGNIGSAPEYREFPNGNDDPRRLLRLNVYFDNPIPKKDGEYEDRGGFWAPVELWHRDAERWQSLYQKGMRVLVEGRTVRDEWEDADDNERVTFKIEARRVGILPYRLEAVTLGAKPAVGQ